MKRWATCVAIICAMVNAHASTFTWDGGASTLNFGDASNWDPDGTGFTTADRYLIEDGSSVTAGSSFSIAGFDLRGSSSLLIDTGMTMTINGNLQTLLDDGTLTVDGTINFGGNRWDASGVSTYTIINVNGVWTSSGNFYGGGQKSIEINVDGSFAQRLTSFGATVNYGSDIRSNVVNVSSSGTYVAYNGLTLRGTEQNVTAVLLNGGAMEVPSGAVYNYSNLILSGDDGIIFTDSTSQMVLAGDRTTDVNTWIADGALLSQVGAIQVNYDSGQDETIVTADPIVDGPFYWDGGAGTTNFGDASNWDPDGTSFRTEDQYFITNGAAVVAGANYLIGALELSGGSALTVDAGKTLTFSQNNVTDLIDGMMTVNGTVDFGGNRWNSQGISTHMIINVNGTWTSLGNFYAGSQKSITINVNGSCTQKLSSFGSTVDYALEVRTNVVNVGSGGTYTAYGTGLVLKGTERNVTAVLLDGGTMMIPSGANYDYTSLVLSGDDGIIFKDAASEIVLAGNRTNDVSTWVSDGALFSEAGSMLVSYDSGNDETVVSIYTPPPSIGNILIDILPSGTNYSLQWSSENGASYAVESTTNLVSGAWTDVATGLAGNGDTLSVTGATDAVQFFFRVYLEQ